MPSPFTSLWALWDTSAPAKRREARFTARASKLAVESNVTVMTPWLCRFTALGVTSMVGVATVTVTVNEALAVLPELSVAAHVTVVVPIGNVLPEGGVHTNDANPPSSEADAV